MSVNKILYLFCSHYNLGLMRFSPNSWSTKQHVVEWTVEVERTGNTAFYKIVNAIGDVCEKTVIKCFMWPIT